MIIGFLLILASGYSFGRGHETPGILFLVVGGIIMLDELSGMHNAIKKLKDKCDELERQIK